MLARMGSAILAALLLSAIAAPARVAAHPDDNPGNAAAAHRCREAHAPGRARGQCVSAAAHLQRPLRTAVAELLGITTGELRQELRGHSLAEVAQAHGVGREQLRAVIIATVQQELAAAVNRGALTPEEANQTLNRLLLRLDELIDRVHPPAGQDGRDRGAG
jgi:hypothetical protein